MKMSAEAQRKIDDRRAMLKRGVLEKGGKWDEAWIVDGVPRTTGVNSGRLDMYYISPDGKRMRSMSEVYSFLGLTSAPPKSNGPAPSASHVAAATATAANSGRGVRGAKLTASAAITATANNPYPAANNSGSMKRPRGAPMPTQQRGLREVREADARMAAVEPNRWRARLFPIDARARAAVDAYDQSLRESTLVDWRCSHNTTVKEYAGRVQPIVEKAQRRCEEEAVRTEQQCGAVAALFPVLQNLVNAFSATGMHVEHVKRATATLTACEAHHRIFTKDQVLQTAALACTLGALKDELAGASTAGHDKSQASRMQLPSVATAAAISSARVAAHTAAAAAGNPNSHTATPDRMPVTTAAAATASAAASAVAAAAQKPLPSRHSNRPTPPLGAFAAATAASAPMQRANAPGSYASTSAAAQARWPGQAGNGARTAPAQPTPARNNNAAASATLVKSMKQPTAAATPAGAAPSTTPAHPPNTGDPQSGGSRRPTRQSTAAAGSQPTTRQSPMAATAQATAAAPSGASTQTRSNPAKPSSASPTAPSGAAVSGVAAATPAAAAAVAAPGWPKFGSTEFGLAPIVSVRAPNGMLKGRLGNPSVCAHADGSLATASGSLLPPAEAVHYIFTLDGVAGKFAGAGASREERAAAGGDNCRSTQKHPVAATHTESQPEKRTGQCH